MPSTHGFAWNVDEVLLQVGPLQIRYYGLLLGLTIVVGYCLLHRRMVRRGFEPEVPSLYLLYALAGFVIGARLGHCFFYKPAHYLSHPLDLFKIWRGGIASHGAAIGLLSAALLFARRHGIAFLELVDATALAAATGATLVRIGNFFNSEIVGRVTNVPWAVRFLRRDGLPRHPSQLYESAGGLAILGGLLWLQRRLPRAPAGLLGGAFLSGYFAFRFAVEFFKEYHVRHAGLTMGQYLSLPFFLLGLGLLVYSLRRRVEGDAPPAP